MKNHSTGFSPLLIKLAAAAAGILLIIPVHSQDFNRETKLSAQFLFLPTTQKSAASPQYQGPQPTKCPSDRGSDVIFDVLNQLTDGLDVLNLGVGHFDLKLILDGHQKVYHVQRICTQVLGD